MAQLIINMTGIAGLSPKYSGDINTTGEQPNLRYLASDGQVVSGIYNPFVKYGYMSPAVASKVDTSGTMDQLIISAEYDSVNDDLYLGGNLDKVFKIDGADGLTTTTAIDLVDGFSFIDLEMYQLNNTRVINTSVFRSERYNNCNAGIINNIDDNSGPYDIHSNPVEQLISHQVKVGPDIASYEGTKIAQKVSISDQVLSSLVRKVRLRVAGGMSVNFDFKVTLQEDVAGNPSGIPLATVTKSTSILEAVNKGGNDVFFDFGTGISISGSDYWIVIEPVTVGDLSNGDIYLYSTDAGTTLYANGTAKRYSAGTWQTLGGSATISLDFSIMPGNSSTYWNYSTVTPSLDNLQYGYSNFFQKADNGLCYWFTKNRVHTLDGGLSGGNIGTMTGDTLVFPSYLNCVDATDTNGLMYIGVQSSVVEGATTFKTFNGDVCGVYVWDRLSTVVRTRDYIPLPGVKEIKRVFQTRDGDVRVITINNDRKTEVRGYSNGSFNVIYQLGTSAYPAYRDSLTIMNDNVVWLGYDGKVYAIGKVSTSDKEGLYIIGDISAFSVGVFTAGIIVPANKPSSGNVQAFYVSYKDGTTPKLIKWYPHGTGTINSVAQVANQGNVYTPVTYLSRMSDVHDMHIYCAPGTNVTTDTVATVKLYFNQSSTAGITKTITKKDVSRGYVHIDIGKSFINAIQVEVEWDTSLTLGVDDFTPSMAVVNYSPTNTHSPSAN